MKISDKSKKLREKGQFEPDKKTTVIIADYFNVTIDYLLGREDWITKRTRFIEIKFLYDDYSPPFQNTIKYGVILWKHKVKSG